MKTNGTGCTRARAEGGALLGDAVRRAVRFGERLFGRMGRPPFRPGEGLWLQPCGAVHTWFCRGPMDLVFLDRDGRVLRVALAVPPWRLRAARGAVAVLELAATAAAGVDPGERVWLEAPARATAGA